MKYLLILLLTGCQTAPTLCRVTDDTDHVTAQWILRDMARAKRSGDAERLWNEMIKVSDAMEKLDE